MDLGDEFALHTWQLDVGAVATLEAFHADGHLFTLQTWRNAAHKDHDVGLGDASEQGIVVEGGGVAHIEHAGALARTCREAQLQFVGLAGLAKQAVHRFLVAYASFQFLHHLAIDIKLAEGAEHLQRELQFLVFLELYGGGELCREVFEVDSCGKGGSTECVETKVGGILCGCCNRAAEVGRIIIGGAPTWFAIVLSYCHQAGVTGLESAIAALFIDEFARLDITADAVEDGHRAVGSAVVVAPKHNAVVGIRSDHGDGLLRVEGKKGGFATIV